MTSRPVADDWTVVAARGLAHAATGTREPEQAGAATGLVVGRILGGTPRDTSIVPAHDLDACAPFTESRVPSLDGGVGNAAVWLEGTGALPPDDAPRRVTLALDGCRLAPRVQRVAAGATVLVSSHDPMMSRLQFIPAGAQASRATILLSDAGQVVPTAAVASTPGLIEVRDDRHPWVRGWLVVAPHPFVAVTGPDGRFRFDRVPPGRYTLVVWQEALGVRRTALRIGAEVETRVAVRY